MARDEPPVNPAEEAETVIAPGWEETEVVATTEVVEVLPRRRPPLLWPGLLALLVLVLAGIGAAYYLSQRDDAGTTTAAEKVTVPDVVGLNEAAARSRLIASGLEPTSTLRAAAKPKGTVVQQTPTAGARAAKGDGVALVVSKGLAVSGVPDVTGLPAAQATAALTKAGFETKATEVFAKEAKGTVVKQTPKPGSKAKKGAVVTLVVSKGQKPAPVPPVVGLAGSDAISVLRSSGFAVIVAVVPSTKRAGTVVAQNPAAGTVVASGSRVRVNIAAPPAAGTPAPTPAKATVPDVVGQPRSDAVQAFADAGLKASIVYVPSQELEGTVVAQAKPGGTELARGSTVQVNVSLGPNPGEQVAVPDVVGLDEQSARDRLKAAGFKVQVLPQQADDPSQEGLVLDQQPMAGSNAPRGSEITIYVGTART